MAGRPDDDLRAKLRAVVALEKARKAQLIADGISMLRLEWFALKVDEESGFRRATERKREIEVLVRQDEWTRQMIEMGHQKLVPTIMLRAVNQRLWAERIFEIGAYDGLHDDEKELAAKSSPVRFQWYLEGKVKEESEELVSDEFKERYSTCSTRKKAKKAPPPEEWKEPKLPEHLYQPGDLEDLPIDTIVEENSWTPRKNLDKYRRDAVRRAVESGTEHRVPSSWLRKWDPAAWVIFMVNTCNEDSIPDGLLNDHFKELLDHRLELREAFIAIRDGKAHRNVEAILAKWPTLREAFLKRNGLSPDESDFLTTPTRVAEPKKKKRSKKESK